MTRFDPPASDHREPTSRLAVRTLATIGALLLLFLLAGWFGYRAYLATPDVVSAVPPPSRHAAAASRVVLFVIDAFTPEKAFDPAVMPTFGRLAAAGASGVVQTDPVTTTAPCVYSLTTGRPGNLVQAIFNFHSRPTTVDSLLSLVAADGGRLALAGDPAWHRQFGWLVPAEDRHESPEPGITIEHHIDAYDAAAVEFLLGKYADPRYRLLVVHLGSLDAVGHMVTPRAPRYAQQMTFLDGLLARTAAAIDTSTTLLLVTGDHGMASRGTHGGEDEARRTPYVLVGPGVRAGVRQDLPQTALTSTLLAVLGLPFLPVSLEPPAPVLLDRPASEAEALVREYFDGKRHATATQASHSVLAGAPATDAEANQALNDVLFGAEESRAGFRTLAAASTMLGVLGAALLLWRSAPRPSERPAAAAHLALALAAPAALALVATGFLWMRSAFAFRSSTIAMAVVTGVLAAAAVVVWIVVRFPRLTRDLDRWRISAFVPTLVVLTAPLVNSHWLHPRPYFELLLLAAVALMVPLVAARERWARLPAVTAAMIYVPQIAIGDWPHLLLPLLAVGVVALALRNLRTERSAPTALAATLVLAIFAAAFGWRAAPSTSLASVVLALFFVVMLTAMVLKEAPRAAAALLIASSTALFLVMASDVHEELVFCATAAVALAVSRIRIDLARPGLVYLVATVLVLLRICLYFELGDQYNISSIRTAPGFLLADSGLPLATVIGLLLLKYGLPWIVILAMALPSLAVADRRWTTHLLDLLVVGYVVRFAAVAAVADPFRVLPNGMDGIVGMFCVTWAELLTFGLVATFAATLVGARRMPAPEVVTVAA
ncbi:MAG: alkaline phosphatase family protein [Deltaproteobacteria bacterium]|nr:alkaline phosphatase family protein [Deltaproteobacteria bacterium]